MTIGCGGGDAGKGLVWGRGLEWPEIISYFWYITSNPLGPSLLDLQCTECSVVYSAELIVK